MTPAEAVSKIKSFDKPDRSFKPNYDISNGWSAWKFGDLCRRNSYESAREWSERMVSWEVAPHNCQLFTTFRAFLEAEKSLQNE